MIKRIQGNPKASCLICMGEFYEIKEENEKGEVVTDGVGSLIVDILRGFFACAKGLNVIRHQHLTYV